MRKGRIIAAILCVFMLITACGKSEPQTMTVSLESNPTTGYTWTAVQNPELFTITDEYIENEHEEGMTGVGGQQVFLLLPNDPGTCEITFTYSRSWEQTEADTSVSYTVEISKNKHIKVLSSKFAGGDDINSLPAIPKPVIE